MIVLPAIDANDQLIEATLDGRGYYVGLGWNQSAGFWTVSVRNLDTENLYTMAGVPNWPLLRGVRRPDMPPGELVIGLTRNRALDRRSFVEGTAALVYFDPDDLEQLAADA